MYVGIVRMCKPPLFCVEFPVQETQTMFFWQAVHSPIEFGSVSLEVAVARITCVQFISTLPAQTDLHVGTCVQTMDGRT